MLMENKWRASRWGIDGKLLDFGKEIEVPFRDLVAEMLEFVDEVVDDLGSRKELEGIQWILDNGSGADRQLRAYHQHAGDLKKVIDFMCDETSYGLELSPLRAMPSTDARERRKRKRPLEH